MHFFFQFLERTVNIWDYWKSTIEYGIVVLVCLLNFRNFSQQYILISAGTYVYLILVQSFSHQIFALERVRLLYIFPLENVSQLWIPTSTFIPTCITIPDFRVYCNWDSKSTQKKDFEKLKKYYNNFLFCFKLDRFRISSKSVDWKEGKLTAKAFKQIRRIILSLFAL